MLIENYITRSIADQTGTLAFSLDIVPDNQTGEMRFGFSGDSQVVYTLKQSRIYTNVGAYVGSYSSNNKFNLSGLIYPSGHDLYKDGIPVCIGEQKNTGKISSFFFNPISMSPNCDLFISGKIPDYSNDTSGTFDNLVVSGRIINNDPSISFTIFSGQVMDYSQGFFFTGYDTGVISGTGYFYISTTNYIGGLLTVPLRFYTNFGNLDFNFVTSGTGLSGAIDYFLESPILGSIKAGETNIYDTRYLIPSGKNLNVSLSYVSGSGIQYIPVSGTGIITGLWTGEVNGITFVSTTSGTGEIVSYSNLSGNYTGLTTSGVVSDFIYPTGNVLYDYSIPATGIGTGTFFYEDFLASGYRTGTISGYVYRYGNLTGWFNGTGTGQIQDDFNSTDAYGTLYAFLSESQYATGNFSTTVYFNQTGSGSGYLYAAYVLTGTLSGVVSGTIAGSGFLSGYLTGQASGYPVGLLNPTISDLTTQTVVAFGVGYKTGSGYFSQTTGVTATSNFVSYRSGIWSITGQVTGTATGTVSGANSGVRYIQQTGSGLIINAYPTYNTVLCPLIPLMSGSGSPYGFISSNGSITGSGFSGNDIYAFARNTGLAWRGSGAGGWVQYDFGSGYTRKASSYSIRVMADSKPTDFYVSGYRYNSGWALLDTQTGVLFNNNERRLFPFTSSGDYEIYQLSIAASDSGYVKISEFQIYTGIYPQSVTLLSTGNYTGTKDGWLIASGVFSKSSSGIGTGEMSAYSTGAYFGTGTLTGTVSGTVTGTSGEFRFLEYRSGTPTTFTSIDWLSISSGSVAKQDLTMIGISTGYLDKYVPITGLYSVIITGTGYGYINTPDHIKYFNSGWNLYTGQFYGDLVDYKSGLLYNDSEFIRSGSGIIVTSEYPTNIYIRVSYDNSGDFNPIVARLLISGGYTGLERLITGI